MDLKNKNLVELNAQELREIGGGGFAQGASDSFAGKPPQENAGFWYYVGYYAEVMAGGYNYGADLHH